MGKKVKAAVRPPPEPRPESHTLAVIPPEPRFRLQPRITAASAPYTLLQRIEHLEDAVNWLTTGLDTLTKRPESPSVAEHVLDQRIKPIVKAIRDLAASERRVEVFEPEIFTVPDPAILKRVTDNNQARIAAEQGLAGRMMRLEKAMEALHVVSQPHGHTAALTGSAMDKAERSIIATLVDRHNDMQATHDKAMLGVEKRLATLVSAFEQSRAEVGMLQRQVQELQAMMTAEDARLAPLVEGGRTNRDDDMSSSSVSKNVNAKLASPVVPPYNDHSAPAAVPAQSTLESNKATDRAAAIFCDKLVKDAGRFVAARIHAQFSKTLTKKQRRMSAIDNEAIVREAIEHFSPRALQLPHAAISISSVDDDTAPSDKRDVVDAPPAASLNRTPDDTLDAPGDESLLRPKEGNSLAATHYASTADEPHSDYFARVAAVLGGPLLARADYLDETMLAFEKRMLDLLADSKL